MHQSIIFNHVPRPLMPWAGIDGQMCCDFTFAFVLKYAGDLYNMDQSRTNGPINAHLTIAQVMPRYNHNNEKQEALL